jgi:PPOX class probable F420-dependent enzyme
MLNVAGMGALLKEQRVARLATIGPRGRPHVVPVVFAYAAGRIYTPLDLKPKSVPPERLQRVRNILANPHVQVLVDRYDEDWRRLAYVQLRGRADLIAAGAEYRRAIGLLERKYPQYAALPLRGRPVIRVVVERAVSWGTEVRRGARSGRPASPPPRRQPRARQR